jgi:hypothetical protein
LPLLLCAALAACGDDAPADLAPAPNPWVGRWNGPEGTWLQVSREPEGYQLTIRDLDGATTFAATEYAGRLEFRRGGETQSLRPTDGAGTGMKWLQDKSECLVVRYGEGWCRQ